MGLEYGRGGFPFCAPLVNFVANLAPFFAVGRGTWVRCSDFVVGGDSGVPKADKVVPRCGEEMGAGVIRGNRGKG